jgi:hypothetical protein
MAETLVVLVLLAIVGGSLMSVLTKQQQFYNGTGDLIALRTQLRQAEAILGSDLRGISSVGGDITAMTDSSIDFNYTIGTSVACKAPASGNTVIIPATGVLTNGNALTSWITKPFFGDTAYMFDEGDTLTVGTDDSWKPYKVNSLTIGVGSCDPGFNAATANTLVLTTSAKSTILDGAAIRFIRRAHYSLYQSPNDGLWYLGYCSPACGVGNLINPIAGPVQAYQASTVKDSSGIRMTYYDSTGAVTATAAQVARIAITIRGQTTGYVHIQGMTKGVYHDSLSISVALRNRS